MIWWLGFGLAFAVSLYLTAPFIARGVDLPKSDEIAAYRSELLALEQNQDSDKTEITRLQIRLLNAARTDAPHVGPQSSILPILITVCLVGSGLGLYAKLGSPNFMPEIRQQPPEATARQKGPDFKTLLPRFEERLAANPEDATGWTLYGRTLMLAGQPTASLRAYERALELTNTPEIRKEYEAAQTFSARNQIGPSPEDIAAMQALSEVDRQAAIENMVDSLSARLRDEPNDLEGWERLLRARKVLGQNEVAREEISNLRKALPNQADEIIKATGWD